MLISTAWGVQQPAVHQIQAWVIHAKQAARDEPLWTRQALPRNARFHRKGEVCGCDLVALRGDEPPMVVIGELKLSFSLDLVLQAVDRAGACDDVWLAVGAAGRGRLRDPRVRKLCGLLGSGLLGVSSNGAVEVLVEPRPWRPRHDKKRRARLIDEHRKRTGDPAPGGSTRQPIMTAYRQQALACAASPLNAPAARLNCALWSLMLRIFFCAMCMAGSPELSGAFTTSLLKASRRSPDGHQRRSPKEQKSVIRQFTGNVAS